MGGGLILLPDYSSTSPLYERMTHAGLKVNPAL
jgi:hypothetical protein